MSPFSFSLHRAKKEVGISKHIPITHLNDPTVFENENGMVSLVLKIAGVAFDVERQEVLQQYRFIEHQAISALDEHFSVYVTTHRHHVKADLEGVFKSYFETELDQHYHQQFKNADLYVNDIYLTLTYKGIRSGSLGKGVHFFNTLKNKAIKEARAVTRKSQIKALKHMANQLKSTLSDFKPSVLGERDSVLGYSELLHFLSLVPNAGSPIKLSNSFFMPAIASGIKSAGKIASLYPFGRVSQFLSTKQLFFGEYIQFQGVNANDTKFAAMVTIKRYASASSCAMLDPLLKLNCRFISTHSYAVEAKNVALENIKRHMMRMRNVDDPAVSQIDALDEARDMLASEKITMGYHHCTVMLLGDSIAEIEKSLSQCIKCFSDAGFIAIRETLGQEPAFWAQIPTNFKYIVRSSLITSENFVDFAPLHNYQTGFSNQNHLGGAVTLLETPSKTPYWFNFHVKGDKNTPSKGHAILIGGNGSGKTAMMTFMDAQLGRYHGSTFYFDRDRGAEIYIRAVGGVYSTLSPNHPDETCFSPLQLEDTPANRQFNRDLLIQFCKEKEDEILHSETIEHLTHCVHYAYDQLAPDHRTFSNAVKILPISFSKWSSLRRWLRGSGGEPDGEYAYIFDNAVDSLTLKNKMGFDMTHFLDREPASVRTALMMYLFQRIDLSLNGELTTIMLDEGWQYFIDPYWKEKLKRVLPTWRKRNAHLVMATQSPSSVVNSALHNIIMDNVATQIYFANPQAKRSDYIEGLKLTESEFDLIRQTHPQSRLFLVKQEHESALCRLNLAHLPSFLSILSGNSKTVSQLEKIREKHGDDPKAWLPIFKKHLHEVSQ